MKRLTSLYVSKQIGGGRKRFVSFRACVNRFRHVVASPGPWASLPPEIASLLRNAAFGSGLASISTLPNSANISDL
jgi:hypothetical protein